MEENFLMQIRAMAAEMGMSFNEYTNYVLRKSSTEQELGLDTRKKNTRKKQTIWDIANLANKINLNFKVKSLNPDDEIIYG